MHQKIRTDLAMERLELAKISHGRGRGVQGVTNRRRIMHGIAVQAMTVETEEAANTLCKPIGHYFTVSLDKPVKRCDDAFLDAANCIGDIIRELLPKGDRFLIVCLGNPNITPDAIGPACAEQIMVTRHLKEYMPVEFSPFASTSLICPGVLGTTGIESALIVRGAVEAVQPDAVIAIDALAARSTDRLCRTVQICNTGIEPGSGVGNRRYALNRETLHIPVISVGVPTVVDAQAFVSDLTDGEQISDGRGEGLFVTPREIDSVVSDCAKLIGYGINFALHDHLSLEDIDLFIS